MWVSRRITAEDRDAVSLPSGSTLGVHGVAPGEATRVGQLSLSVAACALIAVSLGTRKHSFPFFKAVLHGSSNASRPNDSWPFSGLTGIHASAAPALFTGAPPTFEKLNNLPTARVRSLHVKAPYGTGFQKSRRNACEHRRVDVRIHRRWKPSDNSRWPKGSFANGAQIIRKHCPEMMDDAGI